MFKMVYNTQTLITKSEVVKSTSTGGFICFKVIVGNAKGSRTKAGVVCLAGSGCGCLAETWCFWNAYSGSTAA